MFSLLLPKPAWRLDGIKLILFRKLFPTNSPLLVRKYVLLLISNLYDSTCNYKKPYVKRLKHYIARLRWTIECGRIYERPCTIRVYGGN